ncbi:beta1,4-galactosyltransferase waax [Photorhabdus laumondii subsp. laumondii]|uniref:glycosyltransferase family 25 protein n=1 Tax=Photorhabdus laumondii TaxID=2218628 RepID=UPI0007336C14|nr:glycosyltransferase family 25 protein [Photorhabdus laumondii]KTL62574.1 beta1,4-galactosyltransferase waax [Photorhabdus laumondii subsp. laumondii]
MKIFIVNLKKDVERKKSIQYQAEKLDLSVEFIKAVNGRELSQDEIKLLCPDFDKSSMTLGELGCSLSHLKIYEKMIKENIQLALIMEDDAEIGRDIREILDFLITIDNKKPYKPNIFLLSKVNEYMDTFKKPLIKDYHLVSVIDAALTHGYVINKSAAKRLLDFLRPVWLVADEWKLLRENKVVKLKAVVPSVINLTEHSHNSSIGNANHSTVNELDRQKRKRKILTALRLMFWRVFVRSWVKKVRP